MKPANKPKNKYLVFVGIGFELIGLILVAIYLGKYLIETYSWNKNSQAFLIIGAFVVWFVSLFAKLKNMAKND